MSVSSSSRHATADATPANATENDGKRPDGCSRANAGKKWPSAAAAYGMRDVAHIAAKSPAKMVSRINHVMIVAAAPGRRRAMNSLTTYCDDAASCHGIALRMLTFMAR